MKLNGRGRKDIMNCDDWEEKKIINDIKKTSSKQIINNYVLELYKALLNTYVYIFIINTLIIISKQVFHTSFYILLNYLKTFFLNIK